MSDVSILIQLNKTLLPKGFITFAKINKINLISYKDVVGISQNLRDNVIVKLHSLLIDCNLPFNGKIKCIDNSIVKISNLP